MLDKYFLQPIWTPDRRGLVNRMIWHQCFAVPMIAVAIAFSNVKTSVVSADRHRYPVVEVTTVAFSEDPASASASSIVAVAPSGWRKTKDGWEDVSKWTEGPSVTMRQSLLDKQTRPKGGLEASIESISSIAPWNIAIFQLLAITLIFTVSRRVGRGGSSTNHAAEIAAR